MRRYAAIVIMLMLAGCRGERVSVIPAEPTSSASRPRAPTTPAADPDSVTLEIPARDQAADRPQQGWCAETAIQEALLYYGELVPQHVINAIAKPRNPDLYWSDVPIAMSKLDLRYSKWMGGKNLADFLDWVRSRVREGQPVIAGVKLYPTQFPRWGLDHIVLIVGFETDEALLINTTWGTRERRTIADLSQTDKGISLANRYGEFFAYAIEGRDSKTEPKSEHGRSFESRASP